MPDEFRPFEPLPETQLTSDLAHTAEEWERLGIDPDDFLRCGRCHRFIPSLVEGTEPPVDSDDLCECGEGT
jgi:hypothetical protein